jgi:hypothetical protein
MVAWETRHNLGLDFFTAGVSGDADRPDNIIFDLDDATPSVSVTQPASMCQMKLLPQQH